MKLTHLVAMKAIILATALPMAAQADSLWHPASNEQGFTYHPDHFKSTKTRAQVLAEVEAARKDGTLTLMQRGLPVPIKSSAAPMALPLIDVVHNHSITRSSLPGPRASFLRTSLG